VVALSVIASPSALMKVISFSGKISAVAIPSAESILLAQIDLDACVPWLFAAVQMEVIPGGNGLVMFNWHDLKSTYSCFDAAEKDGASTSSHRITGICSLVGSILPVGVRRRPW
jgi:hypothetical protein